MLKVGSGYNLTTVEDWLGMDLQERIQIILKGKVEFFSNGKPVPVKDALQSLKEAGH